MHRVWHNEITKQIDRYYLVCTLIIFDICKLTCLQKTDAEKLAAL